MQPYQNYGDKFILPNGKIVYVPTTETRYFGRDMIKWISRRWRIPRHFYHLRRGGHVAAARSHLNDSFFLACDLLHCFDSVTRSKIHRALKCLGFSHRDAWEFACKSVIFKSDGDGVHSLPFGFPQSPILASLAIDRSALGSALRRVLNSGVKLSMYMDDMLLSGCEPDALAHAFGNIVEAAGKSGFLINAAKTIGPAEAVEVFNLRLTRGSLSVVERRMRRFEEAVLSSNSFIVESIIGYVGTVNEEQAACLRLGAGRTA